MTREQALFHYCLQLGDSSLIFGHRLSEWTSRGPMLEHDIALTNIALDHLGQARLILSYAGKVEGKGRDEDQLAYWRDSMEFKNSLLCELPNGDFAKTIFKMYLFDEYQIALHTKLSESDDEELRGIAVKSLKETTYHLRYSKDWMLRLGDGTDESHIRLVNAIEEVWPYFGDLFALAEGEEVLLESGVVPDKSKLRREIEARIHQTFTEATLPAPNFDQIMQEGSQTGLHTEHLSYITGDMQSVARAHPGATW